MNSSSLEARRPCHVDSRVSWRLRAQSKALSLPQMDVYPDGLTALHSLRASNIDAINLTLAMHIINISPASVRLDFT